MSATSELLWREAFHTPERERAQRLAQAEAAAGDSRDYCDTAVAWAWIPDTNASRRCLVAAADRADAVRDYRKIAWAYRFVLGDAHAAARTLANCAAGLLAGTPTSRDWYSLAIAWQALGDRDAALDYLAHASAAATTVDELCAIAHAYVDANAPSPARELVARAAALATTTRDHVHLAVIHDQALQDPDGVAAALEHAFAAIATIEDVLIAATAADSEGHVERCIARGHALATTSADWLDLATVSREQERRYLERAAKAAATVREQNILNARRRNVSAATSTAPEPITLTPREILRPAARSLDWPCDPARLLDWLRAQLDGWRIEQIAAGDYGMDYDEHFAALEGIRTTGTIPQPIPWCPLETLHLARWLEGPGTDHLSRAFVCTVLCIDDAGPVSLGDGNESTIAVLLDSCIALGSEAVDGLIALLAAMADAYGDTEMRAFAELALVLAATWRDAGDPRLPALVARLVHDEPRYRKTAVIVAEGWLLGLTNFDQRHPLWRALIRWLFMLPAVGFPHLKQLDDLLLGR